MAKGTDSEILFGENAVLVEEMYQLYLKDSNAVDISWQNFFKNFSEDSACAVKTIAKILGIKDDISASPASAKLAPAKNHQDFSLQAELVIDAYRKKGHFLAKLDPLGLEKLPDKKALGLNIENFGLQAVNLDQRINIIKIASLNNPYLQQLVTFLDNIYSSSIGVEFAHINDNLEQEWLYNQFEKRATTNFSSDEKKWMLNELVKAEGLEQFLHTKFPGAKRFSVEGGESSIAYLNRIIDLFANDHGREMLIGMAHRGRLNVLTNVIGKPYKAIFAEFLGISPFPKELKLAGDVKYHMGYTASKVVNNNHEVDLLLAANPSHLEAVNAVVAGSVRAKQDLLVQEAKSSVMGILIHGDAAFCGQGVVAENIIMAGVDSYNTKGIIHIIINNQVGFTANAADAHPGRYATEIAKITGSPVLHINGDDVEAVMKAADIAVNYRNRFGKDIFIDIICYRKYGHNEGDEPLYTQSVMYNVINQKKSPTEVYANKLIAEQIIDEKFFTELKSNFKDHLNQQYNEAKDYQPNIDQFKCLNPTYSEESPVTGVKKQLLQDLGSKLCNVPADFALHSKLKTLFEQRVETLKSDKPIDWATAEQLAFASLLNENTAIRLVGQDSGRGTFSHRHSVLHDQRNDQQYLPLNNLNDKQGKYFVADSNLSEYAALGFEYGYSLANPNDLVIWEAQFGDFVNGAQIMIDQFIAASETKWLQTSSLVMLLPHAQEGQGPEHSSARLERFLQLAAEDNIQVAYPTTPASIFHLLRRQVYAKTRKPLIIMSPKSLLRSKLAVSTLSELDAGTKFLPILDEQDKNIKSSDIKRVICCSGKVYYDLLETRMASKITNTAIIRLEQLYPFAKKQMISILRQYAKATEFIWVQEEAKNMGAWQFIHELLDMSLAECGVAGSFKYMGRPAAASPATGYLYIHNTEQKQLIKKSLNLSE